MYTKQNLDMENCCPGTGTGTGTVPLRKLCNKAQAYIFNKHYYFK
jgi:hypothetical protein